MLSAVCVLRVICARADTTPEATLIKHSLDPLLTTKEDQGLGGARGEGDMNFIF